MGIFDTTSVTEDEIITIGTRRAQRSAADTPAPVDVISGIEFTQNAATDVQDLLRTSVPSFNINTQPISDAASIVRPANLRGLSPDNTLVLVNGKRRHRGSVISFLGGGISDGAQGVDISAIPEVPQYWGQPDVKDDLKLFVNTALEFNENVEGYAFGSYATREVTGGFFYRNPTNRGGVYRFCTRW